MSEIKGKWALVTGASSGLGQDFARELARRGANLVLVARREDRMKELAEEITKGSDIRTEVIARDLGISGAATELHRELAEREIPVDLLINNAGFGIWGDYLEIPWEREEAMLQLDIVALAHLTKLFATDMAARGWGRILQVSSIGAYQPCPTYSAYGAAKAFVLNFSEAISFELKDRGVTSTVISPGVTKTEFLEVAGQKPTLYQRLMMMDSPTVTRIGIDAMLAQRRSIVPGIGNTLSAWSVRLAPRRLATWIAWSTMRPSAPA